MNNLAASQAACRRIGVHSGSNFYRSFALLRTDRSHAMHALYAFARLADDAADGASCSLWLKSNDFDWHHWINQLADESTATTDMMNTPVPLREIQCALSDAIRKFSVPLSCFHDIIDGVQMDIAPPIRFEAWEDTQQYCHKVASSVGRACLAIWAEPIGTQYSNATLAAARHCGVAFQLTNILRDIVEDAERDRIYIPNADLRRFGIDPLRWCQLGYVPSVFSLNEIGDWRGLIRVQIERARANFDLGWNVVHEISLDGRRMFSLMWSTYRKILDHLERRPESIWLKTTRLSRATKIGLFIRHAFTPFFGPESLPQSQRTIGGPLSVQSLTRTWEPGGIRVAVIGAGLAGIGAAMHLARHGCRVVLLESKHRIGGRVGSFVDVASGNAVDYCQHVGMRCCNHLVRWLEDTDQRPFWSEQETLHFISNRGKKIRIGAWPLPAPLHLFPMIWKWPDLTWMDRIRLASALRELLTLDVQGGNACRLTVDWLQEMKQSERCVQNFWSTILVSALGEQINRVTLGPTKKVLVDGFAAQRSAFHLLVPELPLSTLFQESVAKTLQRMQIDVRLGSHVTALKRMQNRWQLQTQEISGKLGVCEASPGGASGWSQEGFDAVLIAVPWNKVTDLVPAAMQTNLDAIRNLQSSPITGVHTWWDRPWFQDPHAILINRYCQWIFPGPASTGTGKPGQNEHYYQIVISGSRDLRSASTESILKCVKDDLSQVFAEAAVATLLRGVVVTDRNAVFSVSPEHFQARLQQNQMQAHQIWIAGDWTDTQWPATMEGALRSGAMAASSILTHFGRPTCLDSTPG